MKLIDIINENNILIPRKIEDREKNHLRITNKKIQEYIKNGSKGDLVLNETPITKLPDNLKEVGGGLYLHNTPISSLPEGLKVNEDLYLTNSKIILLPEGLYIGGTLNLNHTLISSLPKGLTVGGSLFIRNTPLSRNYSEDEIRKMVSYVGRNIYT